MQYNSAQAKLEAAKLQLDAEASNREVSWKAELIALDNKLKADVVEANRLQAAESARLADEASHKAAANFAMAQQAQAELKILQTEISRSLTQRDAAKFSLRQTQLQDDAFRAKLIAQLEALEFARKEDQAQAQRKPEITVQQIMEAQASALSGLM